MGRTAAQRRAARRRQQQRRARVRPDPAPPPGAGGPPLEELIRAASWAAGEADLRRLAAEFAARQPDVDAGGQVTAVLLRLLGNMWELGWEPLDAVHLARRQGPARLARLAAALVAHDAQLRNAANRGPEEWSRQVAALDPPSGTPAEGVHGWQTAEGLDPLTAWRAVLTLVMAWTGVGRLPELTPPPSRWGQARPGRPGPATGPGADARALGRIRALLAKAESTAFPEEAEALTAKAQELMTRHAVDTAVLAAERGRSVADAVAARRVHVDDPHAAAKVQLLDAVARVNGVRVVWLQTWGIATAVGLPADLDGVDLLFTSLLVQATRAMAGTGRTGGPRTRSTSFRRAFLLAYAARIGERLAEARRAATREETADRSAALVPLLRARDEAVDDTVARLFPRLGTTRVRTVDPSGWVAGRLAADTADLGTGRSSVTS